MIKSALRIPFNVLNWTLLRCTNTEYKTFPTINGFLWRRGKGKLQLGSDVKINSSGFANPVGMSTHCTIVSLENAIIRIGNGVGISNALIYAREMIEIQDQVMIGGGSQIWDNDFHSLQLELRLQIPDPDIRSAPVILKRGCFIGANCIILKGVTVGEQSVVAAGSVVSQSIPDGEIWGGNPAKCIRVLE